MALSLVGRVIPLTPHFLDCSDFWAVLLVHFSFTNYSFFMREKAHCSAMLPFCLAGNIKPLPPLKTGKTSQHEAYVYAVYWLVKYGIYPQPMRCDIDGFNPPPPPIHGRAALENIPAAERQ
jgi:hypothetical protein